MDKPYTRSWEGFHCYILNGRAGSNWLNHRRFASGLPDAMFSPQRRAGLLPPQALLPGTELLHTIPVHRRQQAIGRRRLERGGICRPSLGVVQRECLAANASGFIWLLLT